MSKGYIAYTFLDEKDRWLVIDCFDAEYSTLVGHHVTEQFGVSESAFEPKVVRAKFYTAYSNSKYSTQCVLVTIDDETHQPDSERRYHMTLSYDKHSGGKPVLSNKVLEDAEKTGDLDYDTVTYEVHMKRTFIPFK